MKKEHIFIIILIALIAGIAAMASFSKKSQIEENSPELATALTNATQCLVDSGAKFYGASWCPHCATQKAFFKKSAKDLPYIECSTGRAGSPQEQVCIDAEIKTYPSWIFADGSQLTGEVSPLDLVNKVNCNLDESSMSELEKQNNLIKAERDSATQ